MDFKQLQSFIAVVEYKSFSKAGEKLFISQPTISTHIRSLEEELKTRLILRSTKSLEITPKGWELYTAAQKIIEIKDNLIDQWNSQEEHILKIGASTLPSTYILPEILPDYNKKYPNTYFVIHQEDSEKIVQEILEDKCKIGMIGMKINHKNLVCIPFYEDQMTIITPVNEYYLKKYNHTSIQNNKKELLQLLQEPIIVRENGSGTQKNANRLFDQLNIQESNLNITARINDPESIKNLVASGLGISVISKKAAENYIRENRILSFDLPAGTAHRSLYLIYKKGYIFESYVEAFLHYILEYYEA